MMRHRAPVEIEILLWINAHAEKWPGSPEFFDGVAQKFVANEVAIKDAKMAAGYRLTRHGRAWVSAICQAPIPRVAFLGIDGKEIEVWP